MEFRYTSDERQVIDYAREALQGLLPLRRLHGADSTVPRWTALAKDGWLHASITPDDDGDALSLPVLAGIAREAGTVAAGAEFVNNAWSIPVLCASITDPSVRASWLARHLQTPGYVAGLTAFGRELGINAGVGVGFDQYSVIIDSRGTFLERVDGQGSRIEYVANLSTSVARVDIDRGSAATAILDPAAIAHVETGAAILRSAALVGTSAEILDRTVKYVLERQQFGQPIGKFQAVKHLCADVCAGTEIAWLGVLYAAVTWPNDSVASDDATVHCTDIVLQAARVGSQLHGGMGFTWESDLHWLLKSALDGQFLAASAPAARRIGVELVETT